MSIYLSGDDELKIEGTLKVQDSATITENLAVSENVIIDGYCQANYFNATSDKRAKENIQPADFSALDIVNRLPVYTFNYKNNPNTVPGLIAQDLLKAELPLELVNNKNASGEKDDYMSIRESKLIYILWKAIQEQQAEIELLKKYQVTKEINQLRGSVGNKIFQRSFFDHIVRNRDDYYEICKYIYENPMHWYYDELSTKE